MKRYIRIFLLHFQDAFESRSRSVVWFLLALLNPLIALLFWQGALKQNHNLLPGWNIDSIGAYYSLLIVANALLHVHIEEHVAYEDIQQGKLSIYLIRPFSYLYTKLCVELPYRIIQGLFATITLVILSQILGLQFIHGDLITLFLAGLITVFALIVCFLFKMIIGLSALWLTDSRGLQELVFVVMLTFAGFIMPIELFPPLITQITHILPFPYMIYFPIVAFQGKLGVNGYFSVIGMQLVWIGIFIIIYRRLWRSGVKLFTGVGL